MTMWDPAEDECCSQMGHIKAPAVLINAISFDETHFLCGFVDGGIHKFATTDLCVPKQIIR